MICRVTVKTGVINWIVIIITSSTVDDSEFVIGEYSGLSNWIEEEECNESKLVKSDSGWSASMCIGAMPLSCIKQHDYSIVDKSY